MNSKQPQQSNNLDRLNVAQNKNIMDKFEQGERVLLSTLIIKINQVHKKQERVFVITNKAIYNIRPGNQNSFLKAIGNLIKKTIKRRIKLTSVYGVTVSTIGSEFVIHVPNEYDYRFQSADFRKQILQLLVQTYYVINLKKMPFYFREDFTLVAVTTTEKDVKDAINRMPTEAPTFMNLEEFQEWSNQKTVSQLIYVPKGDIQQISTGINIQDFKLIKVLGKGAFGKVMMCQKQDTEELYAIKSLRKQEILERKIIQCTKAERKLLEIIESKFLVQLEYAFQTREKIFFVMKFMRGGELFKHLRDRIRFTEDMAKFYAASILLALEHLHSLNVVYRDLKSENVLMDEDGYIKVTDYGLSKFVQPEVLTYSFVGTPDCLAPEIINRQGHSFEVDWWTLGILIYEMVIGRSPFTTTNQNQIFTAILSQPIMFPPKVETSPEFKDLALQLLEKEPQKRLGFKNGAESIKQHAWFKDFNFEALEQHKLPAPIIPKLKGKMDVQNFDDEYTRQHAIYSYVETDEQVCQQFKEQFGPVTYNPNQFEQLE